MICLCVFRLSVLRYSLVRVAKRMFPFFKMQLKVMFLALGNSELCAQVRALSSDRTIFPSLKPKALLSRCESM